MTSSVEIRPKQSIQWFRKIRNQLLMVFLTIVGLIIVIGVLSFNSQAASRSAAETLLSDDTDLIQTSLQLQGDISELRRLEEQFILEVQNANQIDFAIDTYVVPWRAKFVELREETAELNMDRVSQTQSDTDMLGSERLAELEAAFETIVTLYSQRADLVESSNDAFRIDVWLEQEEFAPLRIYALEQGARQLKFVQTGDVSFATQYRIALDQIEPLLAQFGPDQLGDTARQSFEDRHTIISNSLQRLVQFDREIFQQREVLRINLNLIDELQTRLIEQTLAGQTANRQSLNELTQNTTLGILGLITLAGVVAIIYMLNGGRRTVSQIKNLETTINEIGAGNYRARARIISQDETGFVANEMNNVLDATFSLMQSRDEQDAVQDAIFQFMEDVSIVAEGDLTARARGTHALTNDIALSFNETVVNLQYIIEQIQSTTTQVAAATDQVRTTTKDLVEGSQAQSDYIIDTSAAVDEMAISIQHVSQNSLTSSSVSQQAKFQIIFGLHIPNTFFDVFYIDFCNFRSV